MVKCMSTALVVPEGLTHLAATLFPSPVIEGPLIHGTVEGYKWGGCRCDPCRVAAVDWQRAVRRRQRELGAENPDAIPHGSVTGYKNWWCRCEECTVGYQAWDRAYRAGKLPLHVDAAPHGTLAGARTWRCECPACLAAIDSETRHGSRDGEVVGCPCRRCREATLRRRATTNAMAPEEHGTLNGYLLSDCRCRPCNRAVADQGFARPAITRTRDHAAW